MYWVVFWGRRSPSRLIRERLAYCCSEKTYCTDKAKKRLWYMPWRNVDEGVRSGLERALKHGAEAGVDKKNVCEILGVGE